MEASGPDLEEAMQAEIKSIEDAMDPEERAQYEDFKAKFNRDDIPWNSPYDTVRPPCCRLIGSSSAHATEAGFCAAETACGQTRAC